jgi:hypothetical protein
MFKKATLLVIALAAAAMFLALPAWPGTVPVSIVPDGARWVAHLDMEKFVATKLYEYMDKDGRFVVKSRDLTRWLKLDVPKDVAGVTVFGLGAGEKQAVFAVAGKFDKQRLLTLLELADDRQEIPYGGFTMYSTGDDGFGAFVNDGLIVFSESREALEKVLDTAAGKAKNFTGSKLSASLKEVPSGAFISAVVEDLSGLGREINQSKLVEKASGMFFLAQEKGDNLQVRAQVTADSPESAKNMADIVQGFIALGRLSEGQGHMAGVASFLDGLQVKLDGKTIRLEFERPSREIADLISRGRMPHGFFD